LPDVLLRGSKHLLQECGSAECLQIQASWHQGQPVISLACFPNCGSVDVWEYVLTVLQEKAVEDRLIIPVSQMKCDLVGAAVKGAFLCLSMTCLCRLRRKRYLSISLALECISDR
jgi:hypothetical protein